MTEKINRLNQANDVPVFPVTSGEFAPYGRVVQGYDFSSMIAFMEQNTAIPPEGNIYMPSIRELETDPTASLVRELLYGGMEIEIGYCNGRNTTYNGFEYHKGSEINVAATDFMLVLGHVWQIRNQHFHVDDAQVFFVEKGTAIEMYQTTLHLSPCRVCDEGFRDIVILPKGTNTPLEAKPDCADPENRLLLQKNKWIIAHPEREPLVRQGAFPGVDGPNRMLRY